MIVFGVKCWPNEGGLARYRVSDLITRYLIRVLRKQSFVLNSSTPLKSNHLIDTEADTDINIKSPNTVFPLQTKVS